MSTSSRKNSESAPRGRRRSGSPEPTVAPSAADGLPAILPKIAREFAGLRKNGKTTTTSEADFRARADHLPTMMWETDATGACVYVNARWHEFTGQTAAEGLGDGWLDAVHPEDRPRTVEIFREASVARRGFRLEYRLRRSDGIFRWMLGAGEPRVGTKGELQGYVGSVIDITERRLAEDAARENAARLRLALSAARLGDWSWDATTDVVTLSERAAEIFGVASDQSVTWTALRERLHIDDRARAQLAVERALRERADYDVEYRVSMGEGAWRWVAAKGRGRYGSRGEVAGMMGIVQDVTDRRAADEQVRASEARLKLATSSGKVGVWEWEIRNDRMTWTDSLYVIHGVTPETFGGRGEDFLALIHPEDRRPVERAIQSSLDHNVPYELEFRALRPNGAIVWLFTNAIVMREAGEPVRMIGATFDITARKRAELGLRESEGRFRTLASHAPVGIFLTDVNGDALFVNETWRTIAGLAPEQVRGKGWTEALHPDDREQVEHEWYAAVRERRSFDLEYRFRRPDGVVTWVQGSAVEFRNASGGLVGYLGTIVDITQRKSAEVALRESEKRFRTLASHAPVGIFLTDPKGETIFVNESWCVMAGLRPDEAMGRGWSRAMHPDDRARVAAEWSAALVQNRASMAEYRFVRHDGTVTWVQGNAVQMRDDAGRLVGYIGTVADLTQRKAAEEQLRAREAQLRVISMNAPIVLAHCSRDHRYLFVNRAYAERFGLKPEAILGRTLAEVMGEEAVAAIRPHIEAVLAGQTVEFEGEVPYRDLGKRYMRVSYVPDFAPDGTVRGWLAAVTDFSDRRRMEEALRESEARLQAHAEDLEVRVAERTASLREAIAQMEEFSYSVSHDLRAPLRAMNAYAQALVEDYGPQLDETARGYLERIQRSSVRMEKLTHDVLTYSRVARAEVKLADIDVEQLVRDVVSQYRELQSPAADVEVVAPLASVHGHESSLGQCLANLLTNSVKFVDRGVKPRIRIYTEAGERVRLWIEDNGIGIAPEYQARLFRVFERVPTRLAYEGTGIGLAIVRKAMEKMGGTCGVVSDGRNGSRFWIELPKANA